MVEVREIGLHGDDYGDSARLCRRGVGVGRIPGSIVCGEASRHLGLSWADLLSYMAMWLRFSGVADVVGHDLLWEGTSCPCRLEVGVPLGRPLGFDFDGMIGLTRDGARHAPCSDHILVVD